LLDTGYLGTSRSYPDACIITTPFPSNSKQRITITWKTDVSPLFFQRDYDAPFHTIPGHGRYQHFSVGGRDRIAHLLSTFHETVDNTEKCRRLVDLFLVSVLLDAGAGTSWSFKSSDSGKTYKRSEGLAIASLEMFKTVSSDCSLIPNLCRRAYTRRVGFAQED
jgi:hypothetical protein